MKIKLKSNGQIINPPLRVAERYIRLGRAYLVEEIVEKKVEEVVEVKEEKPKVVKKSKKKKTKKEVIDVKDNIPDRQLDSAEDRADTDQL
jgi:hypothetical protein